jgi:hypothetical protein
MRPWTDAVRTEDRDGGVDVSPKRRKARLAPFDDETTTRFDPEAVPQLVDEDITMPVDAGEMQAAARAAQLVADPDVPPRIIRRPASTPAGGAPTEPYAEVQIAGTAKVVTLPAHNLSPSGVALAVPDQVSLTVETGATVMVLLHLGLDAGGQPVRARVPAIVAHHRPAGDGKPGGLSLRWDHSNPRTAVEIERVLTERT